MIGVCIVTYNQEAYIAQAIESVLGQVDCGHNVIAYIGNDGSTDKTGSICLRYAEQYPDKVVVMDNPTNLGVVGNTMHLLDRMRKDGCTHIAMLDGDDYWSDDHKLQKQMAYMDAHPDVGLVHTCVDVLYPDRLVMDKRQTMPEGDVSSIISGYKIGNCSVVFNSELLDLIDFDEFKQQGFMSCDFIMYVIFSCHTHFAFLPAHTAVWRREHASVSDTHDMEKQMQYVQNDIAMWRYAAKRFPERWTATEQDIEQYRHYRYFAIAFRYGDRRRALHEAAQMGETYQKQNKLKMIVAHSALLTTLWNKWKRSLL